MASPEVRYREHQCKQCGTSFKYEIGKGKTREHCSLACRSRYRVDRANARNREKTKANPRKISGRYRTGAGYIKILQRGHPLADGIGHAYEHRLVAYEAAGGADPQCFWCGIPLSWQTTVVDHLNEQKDDNRLENLVCACNDCNRARGAMVPFIRSMRPEAIAALVDTFKLMRKAGVQGNG